MNSDTEMERCPICPVTGPPSRLKANETNDISDELYWIACSKCETWYHSTCLIQGTSDHRSTVPEAVTSVLADHEGAWTNWTGWIDKWYCRSCLDASISPDNPRPPRHPLKATVKSGYPPKSAPSSIKKVRQPSTNPDDSPGPSKRPRISSSQPEDGARPKRKAAENAPDYHAWNHGIPTPTGNWMKLIQDPEKYGADIREGDFPRVNGGILSKQWLDSSDASGLSPEMFYGPNRQPILVRPEDGGIESMGGKLPDQDLTVADVAEQVGRNHPVDVIDVASQTSAQWNLGKWAGYFKASSEPDWNGKVYNIISLEITGTPLAKKVTPPRIVREIDWVDNYWHFDGGKKKASGTAHAGKESSVDKDGVSAERGGEWVQEKVKPGAKWPKVQLYCLMGIRGSWTDWHVDFAASSVYYSIHTGAKEFYFIRPTEHNLRMYAQWSGDAELQQSKWLGDMCEGGVEKIRITAGDTMIIPAGYIHAVYTPVNTIVFGGNFLHSYSIPTQLRLRQIEIDTKVPQRFRFPFLERLMWYVADKYCSDLRHLRAYRVKPLTAPLTPPNVVVLRGLRDLAKFLQGQMDILEDEAAEEKKKKLVYDRIPGDVVRDPSGLARELKWRVDRELPESEREVQVKQESKPEAKDVKPVLHKKTMESRITPRESRMTGFKPRPWEPSVSEPSEVRESMMRLPKPQQDGSPGEPSLVDIRSETFKQTMRRQYSLVDGKTVVEEKLVELTELRYIWREYEKTEAAAKIEEQVEVVAEG